MITAQCYKNHCIKETLISCIIIKVFKKGSCHFHLEWVVLVQFIQSSNFENKVSKTVEINKLKSKIFTDLSNCYVHILNLSFIYFKMHSSKTSRSLDKEKKLTVDREKAYINEDYIKHCDKKKGIRMPSKCNFIFNVLIYINNIMAKKCYNPYK